MAGASRRHRAQAGTTLIELVVSMMIIGLALVILVGAFSTGVIDATLVKRNTAADAAAEFELERVQAAAFNANPQPYSDCFEVDAAASPALVAYQAGCPAGYDLRLDVSGANVQAGAVQRWTVQVKTYPGLGSIGSPLSVYKLNR